MRAIKKILAHSVPEKVLNFVLDEVQKIHSGEIILVAQDGYLMQVEISNRRRIADWTESFSTWNREVLSAVAKKICEEFSKLDYGRLVVKIQKNRITQIERTVQSRFTGLDGEGI